MMSCYSNYVQDHVHALETFFEVSKEPNFRQFLGHLHSKPSAKGLTLPELLAVPLDRVSSCLWATSHLLQPFKIPYIGNRSQKKKFANFANMKVFVIVFLHYFPGLP